MIEITKSSIKRNSRFEELSLRPTGKQMWETPQKPFPWGQKGNKSKRFLQVDGKPEMNNRSEYFYHQPRFLLGIQHFKTGK